MFQIPTTKQIPLCDSEQTRRQYCEEIFKLCKAKFEIGSIYKTSLAVIGCGDGDIMMQDLVPILPATITKIIGIDSIIEKVHNARVKYASESPRVTFMFMPFLRDGFEPEENITFNHVISLWDLRWLDDMEIFFENIMKLMKPKATAVLMFESRDDSYKILKALMVHERWKQLFKNVIKSPFEEKGGHKFLYECILDTAKECGFGKDKVLHRYRTDDKLTAYTYLRLYKEHFEKQMGLVEENALTGDASYELGNDLSNMLHISDFIKIKDFSIRIEIPMTYCTVMLKK